MTRTSTLFVFMAIFLLTFMSLNLEASSSQPQLTLRLTVPKQISPKNGSHFTHYPRNLTLRWRAVRHAAAYDVEIDCLHCRKSGQWDSQNGPAWKTAEGIKETGYSFTFVGDNRGRWRVRATRGSIKSMWSSWWSFDFKTKPGSGESRKLPDLVVSDIQLIKNCKIQVTIKNIGTKGVPDSYYNLPDAVGVQMYNGSQAWGGIILSGFDPAGHLKSPGGTATHTWFPDAANLNLAAGWYTLKVVVDHAGVLTELEEDNNSLTRRVQCKKILVTDMVATTTQHPQILKAPQRFTLGFDEARLVYNTNAKNLQIITGNKVLVYGGDWEKCKMSNYLYHLKQKFWKGFYWKINTSRKEVYEVTGGTFCQLGGNKNKLDFVVEIMDGTPDNPNQFLLRMKNTRMVYVPSTKTLQIAEGNKVLSYGNDWDKCNFNAYTYHLKHNFATTFFWKVNTSNETVVEVTGGTFCGTGGAETSLDFSVQVVK